MRLVVPVYFGASLIPVSYGASIFLSCIRVPLGSIYSENLLWLLPFYVCKFQNAVSCFSDDPVVCFSPNQLQFDNVAFIQ